MDSSELEKFIKICFIHSWLKDVNYSYHIALSKSEIKNNPSGFGVFLITSNNKINKLKLNLLHIALNIALNNISNYLQPDSITKEKQEIKSIAANFFLPKELNDRFNFKDKKMQRVDFEITKFARYDSPVLITGETGVGKDLAAYQIHKRSSRADKPFVRLPIKSFAEALLESELFGYEKGAFTGAFESKIGKLEAANQGTIYLPEISEFSLDVQKMLLNFLQYQQIERVGSKGNSKKLLDVRLIFASNEDLIKKNQ